MIFDHTWLYWGAIVIGALAFLAGWALSRQQPETPAVRRPALLLLAGGAGLCVLAAIAGWIGWI